MMQGGKEFTVSAKVNGQMQEVMILESETSDGISFYNCRINGNEITQIRKDDQHWKQVWGNASQEDVNAIGEAIEGAILNE